MIGILFCKYFGEVIGEVTESLSGGYTVKNPERIHHAQEGSFSVKILLMAKEDTINIKKEDLALDGVFNPLPEAVADYENRYKKEKSIHIPEKKLIL